MLNTLHCENFRKHAELTVRFTPGINAIRAANEAGKSTLLEAIAYAYFGTKGLKESIDDVVTYGLPTSKLRVEHEFTHTGVQYRITRSPRGAELYANGNDKPLVTGQSEVTKFMERLFGTTQDMAGKLMLSRQKDLGAALNGGPTAAGKMIEDLADLDLIEELVGLVGEKLPAGDTAAAKANVETWRAMAVPDELEDLAPLEAAVAAAVSVSEGEGLAYTSKKAKLDALPLTDARRTLEDERALNATIAAGERSIAALRAALGQDLPKAPADAEISECRKQLELQKQLAAATKLHAELKRAGIVDLWDEPLEALLAEVSVTDKKRAAAVEQMASLQANITATEQGLQKVIHGYQLRRTEMEGQLIKEESCAFCGKDLKDIPEVAQINNPLTAQLQALAAEHEKDVADAHSAIQLLKSKDKVQLAIRDETEGYLEQLQKVIEQHDRAELLFARAEAYIELDRSVVPAKWKWTGPVDDDATDYTARLKTLEEQRDRALAAKATRGVQQQQLDDLQNSVQVARLRLAELAVDFARHVLEQETTLKVEVQSLFAVSQASDRALVQASQAFDLAQEKRRQVLEQAEKAQAALTGAEQVLVEMEANNLLVKKLRAARPAITDKLWASVLGATSTYCASVRGEPSNITRVDGRFKVNGYPVTGLSGSAEDSLGLAIRFALTKTFLPAVDFVMLDEPAAACNDERETAMLGLLATSGFAQTILVTHSTLADAFADNIITI
jgi:hypothetical protein